MKEKKSLHFKLFSLRGTARFEHIMVVDMVIMVVDAAFERHHGSWTLVGPILDIALVGPSVDRMRLGFRHANLFACDGETSLCDQGAKP